MELKQNKGKRRRGVLLTAKGLQRLQEAIKSWEIADNQGQRLTLDQLSKLTNVSPRTLSRLWSLSKGVDQKTLKLCFHAFNIKLHEEYYILLQEENETKFSHSSMLQRV